MIDTRRPPLIDRSSLVGRTYAGTRRAILELGSTPGGAIFVVQLSEIMNF